MTNFQAHIRSLNLASCLLLSLFTINSGYAQDKNDILKSKLTAAQSGDAQAELEYAKALPYEERESALKWAQKAADQKLAEAFFFLGQNKKGGSIEDLAKAAELGYPRAFDTLIERYLLRAGKEAHPELAKKFSDLARKNNIRWSYSVESTNTLSDTVDRCFEAGLPKIPESDKPSEAEKKTLAAEDCTALEEAKDYIPYRKCLLSKPDEDFHELGALYGNGWGVKRNPMLAISFFCYSAEVPAELELIVKELYETRDRETPDKNFTFCNYATSGMNTGICAEKYELAQEKKRQKETETITRGWSEKKIAAFRPLQLAAESYFNEHASSETDCSGSACGEFVADELGKVRNAFLKDLSNPSVAASSQADLDGADRELNEAYRKVMKKDEKDLDLLWGTTSKTDIKKTQQLWLKYRDAWIKFCASNVPPLSTIDWKTELTKRRIEELKRFLVEFH